MKNPAEAINSLAESEATAQDVENTIDIDPCSSPPCKRLKQAVLPFKFMSSSEATTSVSLEDVQSFTYRTCTNTNVREVSLTKGESCRNTGLVTGAPSPYDVKQCSEQQQISRASSGVEGEAMGLAFRSITRSTTPPSLQMNSPPLETEVMAVDPSPAANVLENLEPDCTPGTTSAEKPKKSKEEREKEKLERQKQREAKLREKQEIKAAKEKERLEAKRKREEERQEKLAERERKEKEKLERREKEEKERLEKKEKRDEERKKREEERNAKTEEKRKRDEEKKSLEEEQARKRQKVQESFASYFTKTINSTPKTLPKTCSRFRPFEIKPGMSLAPVTRKQSSSENKNLLDQELFLQECSSLYLKELEGRKPIHKYTKQKLPSIAEDEVEQVLKSETKKDEAVVIIDENSCSSVEVLENKATTVGLKRKLLQFHTNYRPAYFGTWRKYSQHISPKNPFKKDTDLLDYDVDSDDEWEEEEPGESLSNSEGEDEDGEEDGDEDDDGFFVPHGYLSDDEGVEDEDTENGNKANETNCKQAQQLAKAKAWEAEMKKKCKPQKPVIVGCLWHEDAIMNTTLKQFAAFLLVDEPIEIDNIGNKGNEMPGSELINASNGGLYVPNEAMPDLIKLVHGNTAGLNKLVLHFRKQWMAKCLGRKVTDEEVDEKSPISKRQLEKRIQLIATKERRTDRLRWYVHNNVLEKFCLENLQLADACNTNEASTECSKIPGLISPSNTPSIMQFAKTVSPWNRGSNDELKSITSAIKQGHAENEASSLSPMEVDIHAPFHINIAQKTMQSETPVTSNVAFNSFLKGNNVVAPICKKLDLTTAADGKIGSNEGQAMSLPNVVETICID